MTHYAIVDIETTGGDPKIDRITDIAVILHDGIRCLDQFSTLVNPEQFIPPFISELTGITNEMVEGAPVFAKIANQILEMTRDCVFVAHNTKFDYAFMKKEFKALGQTFSCRQLCTVKLSRTLIPGISSYSLGNLCQCVNIPVENRHRALGDAMATVKLFELLIRLDQVQEIEKQTKEDPQKLFISERITMADIEELPEETGIYRLLDENEKLIYIGHNRNIQKRVLNHFISKSKSDLELCKNIHRMTYELTGSNFVAQLWEMKEILELNPYYNQFDRRKVYTYGLYLTEDEKQMLHLEVDRIKNRTPEPVLTYADNKEAQTCLRETVSEFDLCPNFTNLGEICSAIDPSTCLGACRGLEPADYYNARVEEVIRRLKYPDDSFLIICKGPTSEYQSFVLLLDGQYQGFGFVDTTFSENLSIDDLKKRMYRGRENHEVIRIIQQYLSRHTRAKLIPLSQGGVVEKNRTR